MKWCNSIMHNEYRYAITSHNGRYGLIRNDGEIIVDPIFTKIQVSNMRAIGAVGIGFHVYDENGEEEGIIYPDTYGEGLLGMLSTKNFETYFVNRKLEVILNLKGFKFAKIREGFHNNKATIHCDGDLYTYAVAEIDKEGRVLRKYYKDQVRVPICIDHTHLNTDGYELYESGLYTDEAEQEYRDAFEDDPGAESNTI